MPPVYHEGGHTVPQFSNDEDIVAFMKIKWKKTVYIEQSEADFFFLNC